ncbi:MAG: FeoA domain-containing protein, partial [Actinomycetes bacterium]
LGEQLVFDSGELTGLDAVAQDDSRRVTVRRIGEPIQDNHELMASLNRAGVRPGEVVKVRRTDTGVMVGSGMEYAELEPTLAAHVLVALG